MTGKKDGTSQHDDLEIAAEEALHEGLVNADDHLVDVAAAAGAASEAAAEGAGAASNKSGIDTIHAEVWE